jgi:hypothetical protein
MAKFSNEGFEKRTSLSIMVIMRIINFLITSALAISSAHVAAKNSAEPSDDPPWQFTAKNVFAVGDIHGDYAALAKILRSRDLIDRDGNWTGGTAHLVMMGDLNDRYHDHRIIIELLMRLEDQAARAGGRVHTLLGNHEQLLVMGKQDYAAVEEINSFADFSMTTEAELNEIMEKGYSIFEAGMILAFRGDSKYARWLRSRNTIIQINDSLFVHAGLDTWALEHSPAEINASVRAWFRYWQNTGAEMPSQDSAWVIDMKGPLWTKYFATLQVDPAVTDRILEKYQAKRIVVGHKRTAGRIEFLSQKKIVKIDTGISRALSGELSILHIKGNRLTPYDNIGRPPFDMEMRKKEIERLVAQPCMKTYLLAIP